MVRRISWLLALVSAGRCGSLAVREVATEFVDDRRDSDIRPNSTNVTGQSNQMIMLDESGVAQALDEYKPPPEDARIFTLPLDTFQACLAFVVVITLALGCAVVHFSLQLRLLEDDDEEARPMEVPGDDEWAHGCEEEIEKIARAVHATFWDPFRVAFLPCWLPRKSFAAVIPGKCSRSNVPQWRMPRLAWWGSRDECKAGHDPHGSVAVSRITKVQLHRFGLGHKVTVAIIARMPSWRKDYDTTEQFIFQFCDAESAMYFARHLRVLIVAVKRYGFIRSLRVTEN